MPGIPTDVAARAAQAMLAEVRADGSHGAQAQVICRDDHVSIAIEDVELSDMTVDSYRRTLGRLENVARRMSRGN